MAQRAPMQMTWRLRTPAMMPWLRFLGGSLAILIVYFGAWHFAYLALPQPWQERLGLYPVRGVVASLLIMAFASRSLVRRIRAAEAGEATWMALFEAAPDAVLLVDSAGTIALVNSRASAMLGWDNQRLAGRSIEQIVPGLLELSGRNGTEVRARRANGAWFDASASIARPAGSDLTFAILRDISERKRSEAELARLAAIVESSDDAILSKDLDGTIRTWNAGAERLYGYRAVDVVGRNVRLLIPDRLAGEERTILERAARGEHVDHYLTDRMRRDGTLLRVSLTVSPVRDAAGHVVAVSAVARPASEPPRPLVAVAPAPHADVSA